MSKLHLLTEDQAISNKAWQLLNTELNHGSDWDDAKIEAELSAEKMKADFDEKFEPYDDPVKSDIAWNKSMEQFDKLVKTIRSI